VNHLQRNLAITTLCATACTLLPIAAQALSAIDSNGRAVHIHSVPGVVVHVDQARRKITLQWFSMWKASWGPFITESHMESFAIAEGVVIKNGSWSNIVKGAKVRLIGDGDLVDTIKLLKTLPPVRPPR
jgi:hypothetical protein